jgi:hypothetical protein
VIEEGPVWPALNSASEIWLPSNHVPCPGLRLPAGFGAHSGVGHRRLGGHRFGSKPAVILGENMKRYNEL